MQMLAEGDSCKVTISSFVKKKKNDSVKMQCEIAVC